MSRVITFSRYFPKGHPRAGEHTDLVEKIYRSFLPYTDSVLEDTPISEWYCELVGMNIIRQSPFIFDPKHHTIRAGNRWKVGDKFSPRVWSGKPYASKQIIIAPDIEIKKIWHFQAVGEYFYLDGKCIDVTSTDIPMNDGLSTDDFLAWFDMHPKKTLQDSFAGQVLCWNESITY